MITRIRDACSRYEEGLRFVVVGGWNTLFGLGTLWVLDQAIPYDPHSLVQKELVLAACWALSITQNFFSFKLLVFRTRGNWLKEYGRMYVTYAALFALQSAMMLTISQVFGLSVFWANLAPIAVVTILSYLGHKHFTFRRAENIFDGEGG